MNWKHNKQLVLTAQNLRKNMTKEERHLWYDFLRNHPVKFTRQKIIKYYIADFYAPRLRAVIEVDGAAHFTEKGLKSDVERTKFFQNRGITVIRFTNEEINTEFEIVCSKINEFIQSRLSQMK